MLLVVVMKYQQNSFPTNCMKHSDLHRKIMFPSCTLFLLPHPPQGQGFRNMIFMCRSGNFMQYLAKKIFFVIWSPIPWDHGLETWFSVQISTFHAILSNNNFWVLGPHHHHIYSKRLKCVYVGVYKAPRGFVKLLYRGYVCPITWGLYETHLNRGFMKPPLYVKSLYGLCEDLCMGNAPRGFTKLSLCMYVCL